MWPTTQAGCLYFLVVFVAGFFMGTLRVLLIAPAIGETAAVLLEMPVMLTIAWFACRGVLARFAVPAVLRFRLTMGGLAFVLLMAAEIGVSVLGFQRTLADHFRAYAAAPALIGLIGQIAFALFPVAQMRRGEGRAPSGPRRC